MKHLLFYFILLAYSANCYTQERIAIQMKKDNGVWVVQGKVNDAPMNFIFDSGASDVSISLTEARYLFKNDLLVSSDILGSNRYQTASGDIKAGWRINIKRLEVGGLILNNVEASIVNSSNAPILLGQTALSRLGVLTEDFNTGILTIQPNKNLSYKKASESDSYNNSETSAYSSNVSGELEVITNSPILDRPDMVKGIVLGKANGNYVTVVRRTNDKYYYVISGSITGYIWIGWLKK
jgi:clan AA aspartic protease (TIGR02281 family)